MDKKENLKLEKYKIYLKEEAKKFRLTEKDLGNLYDCMWMMDTPKEINQDFQGTLKTNNMFEWFHDLRNRIEEIVVPEIHKEKKEVKNKMPQGDKTGPRGKGPKTGRGKG